MNKLREWVVTDYAKGYKSLELRNCEEEVPGPGEIRLRMEAFALNWGDMNLMEGEYTFVFESLPARVGDEAVGIVDMVGPDVEGIEVGQRYCTLPYYYYNRGASADSIIIESRYVTKAPEGLSAAESSSIWMQYLTGFFPLVYVSKIGPGTNVLVTGATSTAGSAALEIGRLSGANMTGTTRFESNREYLMSKGADHVCISSDDDFSGQMHDATQGRGFDFIYDSVGGSVMRAYARHFAKNCKIYFYGFIEGEFSTVPVIEMFAANATFNAHSMFNYVEQPEILERGKDFVYDQIARGNLKPEIDKIYPMESYIEAWDYLRTNRHSHGKVVIETGL